MKQTPTMPGGSMEDFEKTRIQDPEKAKVEAEKVRIIAGERIDSEWTKLKLAQALGLEREVEIQQKNIDDLLKEAEQKKEDTYWGPFLLDLYQSAATGGTQRHITHEPGFKDYVIAKFGKSRHSGQPEHPGEYVLIPNTDYVFGFFKNRDIEEVSLGLRSELVRILRGKKEDKD